jgi:HD-GYP domain-containing protein (c-di-GMP phosphodiesterase class II)
VTGPIRNLAASFHAGVYVIALNFGRRVTEEDALFLRGFALPGSFLGSVAGEVRDVSDSFLVLTRALALATDSPGDNGAHVLRMNEYARTLARYLSLPERFIRTISYSAQLHDVGKIYIHPDLLEKPLRLTSREFDLIKKHPILGARILGDSPLLKVARNIALTHHECWDGSGYPSGLSGNAIPIEGAIVKIADVYDAIRTMHAYKSSRSHEDACRLIFDGGGDGAHEVRPSHFHPDVHRAFRNVAGTFEEIYHAN